MRIDPKHLAKLEAEGRVVDLLTALTDGAIPKWSDTANCSVKPNSSHFARAAAPRPGTMNKLENAYAHHLDFLKHAGAIRHWMYEPLKLRLADRTTYTPDFLVQAEDDVLELHEVKGFAEDDSIAKFKVARELFPMFRWLWIRKDKDGWRESGMPEMKK